MNVITFWLAIDRSDQENGCLKVIPQTQHKRLMSKDEYVAQTEENAFDIAMDPSMIDESGAFHLGAES